MSGHHLWEVLERRLKRRSEIEAMQRAVDEEARLPLYQPGIQAEPVAPLDYSAFAGNASALAQYLEQQAIREEQLKQRR